MDARKLLEYYYNLILFKPEFPMNEKSDHLVTDEKNYVPYESIFGGESETGYDLYIGKVDTEYLEGLMTKELSKTQSFSYVCMIKTDKRGYYIKGSFYLSPVVFALGKMIKENNIRTSLDLNLINKANEDFNEFITIFDRKLEYKELKEIHNYVVNKLNLSNIVSEFETLVKERDPLANNTQDGYLMDLEYILSSNYEAENIDQIGNKIKSIVKNSSSLKEEIGEVKFKEITRPENNSLGMWPGNRNLSLKEQVNLNKLIQKDRRGLTFYKNIINEDESVRIILEYMASKIVDRAVIMSRYTKPDEAFKEVKFNQNTEYSASYYIPDEKLIASNTLIINKDDEFKSRLDSATYGILEAFGPNPYYEVDKSAYIIQTLTNNKDALKWDKDIWRKKDNGLKIQVFNEEIDYEEARKSFRQAFDKVFKRREEIIGEYKITFGYQDLLEKVNSASLKLEELKNKLESSKASRDYKEKELEVKKMDLEKHIFKMKEFEGEMGLHKKLFSFLFQNDAQVNKYKELEDIREKLRNDLELCNQDLNVIINEFHDIQYEINQTEETYSLRHSELEEAQSRITYYKEKYGASFSDDETIIKLLRDDLTLPVSIWVDEEYDSLRKKLFIESLKLHKAFFNNSRFFKTDIQLFALALEGKIKEDNLDKVFYELFKTSAMLSPITYLSSKYAPYFLPSSIKENKMSAILPETGKLPIYESFGILERFKNLIGFNVGIDHKGLPLVPKVIEDNLIVKLLDEEDPSLFDISLGDILSNI